MVVDLLLVDELAVDRRVGEVAFQAKMLQAWLMLPVIAAMYLLAARPRWAIRVVHVVVALFVAVAISLSWMIAVSLVPSANRPWFDGSVHNSVFEQIFVYNGLGRLPTAGGSLSTPWFGVFSDPGRMVYGDYALGVSWLIPSALLSGATIWYSSVSLSD